MLLATKNQSLQIDLAGAVAANELPWAVEYIERSISGHESQNGARGTSAGATATEMVGAPLNKWGSSTVRNIKRIEVFNKDTAAASVTIQILDGATVTELVKVTLQPNESLTYTDESGWVVMTANGTRKAGLGTSPGQILSKRVDFAAAAVIAMDATPGVLLDFSAMLAAEEVEATDALVYHGAIIHIHDGTTDYDQDADLIAKYQTAGGGASLSLTQDDFVNDGTDGTTDTLKPLATDVVLEAAQDIVLTSTASPYSAAGDRLLLVEVFYSIFKAA